MLSYLISYQTCICRNMRCYFTKNWIVIYFLSFFMALIWLLLYCIDKKKQDLLRRMAIFLLWSPEVRAHLRLGSNLFDNLLFYQINTSELLTPMHSFLCEKYVVSWHTLSLSEIRFLVSYVCITIHLCIRNLY